MVVGIIGKVGSGKSTCIEYLEKEYNAIVFSCDKIAKEIIEKKETDYIALPPGIFFRSKEAQEECRNKIHKIVFERINDNINNLYEQLRKQYEINNLNEHYDFINLMNVTEIENFDNKNNKFEHNDININENNISNYCESQNIADSEKVKDRSKMCINKNNNNLYYTSKNKNNLCLNNYNLDIKNTKNLNKNNFLNKSNIKILILVECALPGEQLFEMCDKTIYIKNSYENKVKWLYNKRGYTEDVTKLIYDSQAYYDKYYSRADIIIENNGTELELKKKIKEVIDEIYIICE